MDNKAQLIEALNQLSHWSRKTADLLTAVDVVRTDDPLVIGIPPCSLSIDAMAYTEWPLIYDNIPAFPHDHNDGRYLIIQNGAARLPVIMIVGNVDIVTNQHPSNLPKTTRIIHLDEVRGPYDYCIIDQSLEFYDDPISVLRTIKRQMCSYGKIIVRFRPWTSPDGGYYRDKAISDKAYLHLATQSVLAEDVVYKVTRPLATYDAMLGKCDLHVVGRNVHHCEVDDFFTHTNILQTIKSRTWNYISDEEALKIMSISAVDYVLQA